jgi:predicted ATPase/DNA-binding SARP family transcriptional activator
MRFGVLGRLAAWTRDDRPIKIPGVKVRKLLAVLLVNDGRAVPADRLIDYLWGDELPADPAAALSVKVSQLRRVLEDAEPGSRGLVGSPPPGYWLSIGSGDLDVHRFQTLVDKSHQTDDAQQKEALLAAALDLWRGPALADFADDRFAGPMITRLEEQRLVAWEDLAQARLDLGRHAAVVADLTDLLAEYPLRERPRALHMLALYRAGRQAEALTSYQTFRVELADELGLDPGAELVDLHQAILAQASSLDAPAPPVSPMIRLTNNLPAPVTGLIGREDLVSEVRAALEQHRLVTLTGTGGVGKTRLAVEVAARVVDAFADGVWMVELSAFERGAEPDALESLADIVMGVLEIHDGAAGHDPSTSSQRLRRALRSRELLLVLDNCEHVIGPVADIAALVLAAAPGLRILATSREPLGLAGEVVRPVPPLETPYVVGTDPATLTKYSAVQLFVARATAAAHGFELTADNADAVALLCRRLDGVPLALELAATRVRTLGVRGLVAGLDDRFRLLATGQRGAPPRQQTLMATIDWSWQLLSPADQLVLRRLAVHADGCTMEAAEVVCATEGVLDSLTALGDRSLAVLEDGRVRLLESVAAFCVERLVETGELDEIRQRHRLYYTDVAERAEPHLYGPRQHEWLLRIDADGANFRSALDGAVQAGDAALALRLVNALAWYWFLRGRLAEAARSFQAALGIPGDTPPSARASAIAWHTGISFLLGDTKDWQHRHASALRLYGEAGDLRSRARAEWFLAFTEIDLGDVAGTGELIAHALDTFGDLGDKWGEAAALSLQAKHAHITGDIATLEDSGNRSIELAQELGDGWCLLQATEWLGASAALRGDYDEGARLHREGLHLAEQLGLWPDASGRLCWLGWIAMQRCDYRSARELCGQGLRLAEEQGSPLGVVFAQLGLGFAARRDGQLDTAETLLQTLLATATRQIAEDGRPLYLPGVLVEFGYLEELRGDLVAAAAHHSRAFTVAQQLDAARDAAQALGGLAGACAANDPERAALLLGASVAAREATRTRLPPADQGDLDRALTAARTALGGAAFTAAFHRGRDLSPDEAFAEWADGTVNKR